MADKAQADSTERIKNRLGDRRQEWSHACWTSSQARKTMSQPRRCSREHPVGIQAVSQGDGRGMLGLKSGLERTAKKVGDTRSTRAELIGMACRRLYDIPFDPSTARPMNLRPFTGSLDGEPAPTRR